MTQLGGDAVPKRSLEKPHLLCFYIALRLVSILLSDNTCLQLICQIWLCSVCISTMVGLQGADVAWGCDVLQRWATNCGGNLVAYFVHESGKRRNCWCIYENSLVFGGRGVGLISKTVKAHKWKFDSTRGYPGKGPPRCWSREHPNLTMTTWNTRSLTFERFEYCKSLKYDVIALTELWRTQDKFQTKSKHFTGGQ